MSIPKIWAHRGVSEIAPENTIRAFELAIKEKCYGIELDVQMTKDGKIVVIHDEYIDRVSNGKGRVNNYCLNDLRELEFNKTHPEFTNCKIPLLSEVLELIKPTNLQLNIELKTGEFVYEGIEKECIKLVKDMNLSDRVVFSSFNHCTLMRVKEIDSGMRIAFLYSAGLLDMPDYAIRYGAEALHPYYKMIEYPGFVDECKEKNIKVRAWSVNREWQMRKCKEAGIDSVIVNDPGKCRQIFEEE